MDDNSTGFKQLLSYLLRPPLVFVVGYGLAVLISPRANEAARVWLDPITWGSIFAIVYLALSLPLSRSDIYYSFGPKPPKNRQLARAFTVSTSLYMIIACELLLFRQRESMQRAFPDSLIILLAVLAPMAISFGLYCRYKAYKEPSSD